MSEGHHNLAHEFPEYKDKISSLKQEDGHFARLYGDYHEICKELHRVESGEETPSDEVNEELKKKRLLLKDKLFALLQG